MNNNDRIDGNSNRFEQRTHFALNSDGEEKGVARPCRILVESETPTACRLPLIISCIISCGDACCTSGYYFSGSPYAARPT